MKIHTKTISAIPTNIITGFLGVGKSSAILNLLKHKPKQERWAVLVNEFGEIGVDGSVFEGQHTQEQGVFIREVPGGCMCCVAGLPMQVALNQLLKLARPDRLLIEPTGLGHPKEILHTLRSDTYRSVINLQQIITLVDARKLSDRRYTEHQTFNEQIAIADVVVGNKQDLYQGDEQSTLQAYIDQHGASGAQVMFTQHSDISTIDLSGKTKALSEKHHHHHHTDENQPQLSDITIPECGYIKALNQGEGFYSIGWRFSDDRVFDYKKLCSFLNTINAERMKATFITNKGAFSYNLTSDALIENKVINHRTESRIEIIDTQINDDWEKSLMECIDVF